ncbi:MAG TPA: GyrI-like domain-containing protein [Lachnospiraceae bacterium]|nr:GyrI-like domain-containing protein [Lachnospiraceae bacterium]
MKIYTENIPAYPVVYMRRVGEYGQENFKLMQAMKEWVQTQNLWNNNGTIYAIAQDNPAIVPPEKCRYDICFVTEQIFDDNVIHHGALPAGAYLICEIPHTTQDVQFFWESIGNILVNEKKQPDESRPILERYEFSLVENGDCEFCLPIFD